MDYNCYQGQERTRQENEDVTGSEGIAELIDEETKRVRFLSIT